MYGNLNFNGHLDWVGDWAIDKFFDDLLNGHRNRDFNVLLDDGFNGPIDDLLHDLSHRVRHLNLFGDDLFHWNRSVYDSFNRNLNGDGLRDGSINVVMHRDVLLDRVWHVDRRLHRLLNDSIDWVRNRDLLLHNSIHRLWNGLLYVNRLLDYSIHRLLNVDVLLNDSINRLLNHDRLGNQIRTSSKLQLARLRLLLVNQNVLDVDAFLNLHDRPLNALILLRRLQDRIDAIVNVLIVVV
uniref:(northern house mosquito) hypothetical protein n=1 Tax=Culex pipiens TaxID=7175 RepID=A0A8D8DPV8_CULPI